MSFGRLLFLIVTLLGTCSEAISQTTEDRANSAIGYATVISALESLRTRTDVTVKTVDGWIVVEDTKNETLWSFTPLGNPAHPTAVRRAILKQGDDIFIQMNVLCEAAKPACDRLVADFEILNAKVRESLSGRRRQYKRSPDEAQQIRQKNAALFRSMRAISYD